MAKSSNLPPRGSGPLLPKEAAKATRKRAINDMLTGNKKKLPPANLTPLKSEDGDNGYWDAKKRGNGRGRSFSTVKGKTTFLDGKK